MRPKAFVPGFINPEDQQRELHRKVDLACLQASQIWGDSGRNPDEMSTISVYVGPMCLSIIGGSDDARWTVARKLRELGVAVDFGAPSVTG